MSDIDREIKLICEFVNKVYAMDIDKEVILAEIEEGEVSTIGEVLSIFIVDKLFPRDTYSHFVISGGEYGFNKKKDLVNFNIDILIQASPNVRKWTWKIVKKDDESIKEYIRKIILRSLENE
jgi:hypothetical protein